MSKESMTNLLATMQVSQVHALTALLRAVSKQPGIDREKLIADLIAYLPSEAKEDYQGFLVTWRELIQTNL